MNQTAFLLLINVTLQWVCFASQTEEFVRIQGQKMANHVFTEFVARSAIECSSKCFKTANCRAVNFNPSKRYCQLCNETPLTSGVIMETRAAWSVYHIQEHVFNWCNLISYGYGYGQRTTDTNYAYMEKRPYSANSACGGQLSICTCTSVSVSVPCESPWIYNDNSCYWLETSRGTWHDIYNFCRNLGAELLEISSSQENVFVASAAAQAGLSTVWLSLNDMAEERTFVWLSGEAVVFTEWGSNEGGRSNGEDCVFMIAGTRTWHDVDCSRTEGFVCEKHID